MDDKGRMLLLNEDAHEKRRTALNVEFKNDYWFSGTSLFLFKTISGSKKMDDGSLLFDPVWDKNGVLNKDDFERWAYQTINQAMRSRLLDIYNESYVAARLGHTYITESPFESEFLSLASISDKSKPSISTKFLEANNSFICIDSPETIIDLRTKYSKSFERFNLTLQNVSEQLLGYESDKFDQKARQLFQIEIMSQIDEMRDHTQSVSRNAFKGGVASIIGLSAAIYTGSPVPLVPSLILIAMSALNEASLPMSIKKRYEKRPAYIWHRITK
ncbi:hypothetical protein BIU88_08115 [Chlorobaculum limnaeum]|uniref:Uncharacterized protein n=2 Tax=Chlorobaculum limnaeum TaxID=274537 RepID=A0A1D8CYW9_CHLLM|nr:hypothetical protein BIU88_08115 [Chlorobaculum limnaeum]